MKVGTIKTVEEDKEGLKSPDTAPEMRRRRGRAGDGGGDDSGGGGDNGGPGDSGGGDENRADRGYGGADSEYRSNKFRIGTGFLLLVVLMTFGGLIGAYIVISTNGVAEWRPFSLPVPVWISTALILTSSITFFIAHAALLREEQERAQKWLLATTVFGGMFIASQIAAWLFLVRQGVYLSSNPYAGFFYLLTAVHAVHVIGGIIALGYVVLRTWQPTASRRELSLRQTFSGVVSWYWHFMDGLWLVLLVLLGFWK